MLDCLGRTGKTVVRWLEIAGNSGSGKSSLMNAGLLPLIDEGWLCRKTGFDRWVRIGPMMPGDKPVRMLAEHLATAFGEEMADVRHRLDVGDDLALADWLRGRKRKPDADGEAAFLLAIDQFEELFTLAEADERRALRPPSCLPRWRIWTARCSCCPRCAWTSSIGTRSCCPG